jgi:hypothetical protein
VLSSFISPFVYWFGYLTGKLEVSAYAAKIDHHNARGLIAQAKLSGRDPETILRLLQAIKLLVHFPKVLEAKIFLMLPNQILSYYKKLCVCC